MVHAREGGLESFQCVVGRYSRVQADAEVRHGKAKFNVSCCPRFFYDVHAATPGRRNVQVAMTGSGQKISLFVSRTSGSGSASDVFLKGSLFARSKSLFAVVKP